MTLSYEEKIEMMRSLNWDYNVSAEDMLEVVEGKLESAAGFDQSRIFLRCLERVPWHRVIALWGVDKVKELYTQETAKRIFPKSLKERYDFAIAILRREPVSPARWGDEHYKPLRDTVFSHRWYRA
ncbi:hypothetical protein LQZ19_09625 [Treponema primitia]|uniref:hypothetical protein n=1 Tax=Treponema primitia TaxID=88058 RepID=UPI00397EF610